MRKQRNTTHATAIPALIEAPFDRGSGESLQHQLYRRIQAAITSGHMPAGLRLPASRVLAQTLGVSRNTVSLAYEQLLTEGYVLADRQGTVVAELRPRRPKAQARTAVSVPPRVSERLTHIGVRQLADVDCTAMRPGVPALSQFPLRHWRKALDAVVRTATPSALNYGDPLGQMPLRAAIASHLALTRGARCQPEQVVMTEGTQEALGLCVRMLTNPGDTVWIEDPGYRGARTALQAGDLRIVPKRMDAEGLQFTASDWRSEQPRLIYTTPSHQYPVGTVMSVARKLALITAAQAHGAWIIEDDYDSEFRHSGDPIGAMQGLVADAPVLYVGTFSKTMFPSLRLGFLVLPQRLLPLLRPALGEMLCGGHCHEQLAMAHFMGAGHFVRHLARMRRLYRERQNVLRKALVNHLGIPHTIEGGHSGMHLCVRFSAQYPDQAVADAAQRYGMVPLALSAFALAPQPQDNGLVLGYGNTPVETMEPLVKRLGRILKSMR